MFFLEFYRILFLSFFILPCFQPILINLRTPIIGMISLKKVTPLKVVSTALVSSLVFFLITNCAFFYPVPEVIDPTMTSYPHTFEGLMTSYTAGLPFLKNQILGDLFFSGVLFGGFALLQKRFEVLKMA